LSIFRFFIVAFCAFILVAGCAKPPEHRVALAETKSPSSHLQANVRALSVSANTNTVLDSESIQTASIRKSPRNGQLAGRTMKIGSISDIRLQQGEVILTFDDGPTSSSTPLVLAALDAYDVKATFFMVGTMARTHAATARAVARAGHTIGSHTHAHENLANLSTTKALQAIAKGETEIAHAISGTGKDVAPFFRFPYLAHTKVLRADLSDLGLVVFDVEIDSLDFKKQTPDELLERTLARLDKRGKGIVLFHDIHRRTASMLPEFLNALSERGYKIVHAVPKHQSTFEMPEIASLN
jgi:peptidoglycan-N-acetylglucosamine deacetylase